MRGGNREGRGGGEEKREWRDENEGMDGDVTDKE